MAVSGNIPIDPVRPVYLIHGPEELLRREAVKTITDAVLDPSMADFNLDKFDGGSCKVEEVVAAAQMLPVMAARRLVILRFVERIKAEKLAPLADYLTDPSPTTCLIFEGEKADMRRAPFSTVKKVGAVVPCQALYERDAQGWLSRRARAKGCAIEPDAARFLVAYAGTHLATLDAELEKAAAYAGSDARIDLDVVEETVGRHRVHTVFELTDALGAKQTGRALAALGTLLDAGEAPLMVQGMIVRHYRMLWRTVEALNAGERNLAAAVGVAPFVANKLAGQARHYSDKKIGKAFTRFAQVDSDLKGGAASPRRTLEDEVLSLCRA